MTAPCQEMAAFAVLVLFVALALYAFRVLNEKPATDDEDVQRTQRQREEAERHYRHWERHEAEHGSDDA